MFCGGCGVVGDLIWGLVGGGCFGRGGPPPLRRDGFEFCILR